MHSLALTDTGGEGGSERATVRLGVAVATRNRRPVVLGALESLAPQLRSGDELIVVDNGSSDGSREAVQAWLAEHCPAGRLLLEVRRGVSYAFNTALRETAAPIICFFGDDQLADPDWLSALRRAWAAAGSRVGAIGGPIHPRWLAPRPAWLVDWLLYVVSALDLGPERRRLDQTPGGGYLFGGNMSVRTEAARAVGGFEPDRVYLEATLRENPRHRPPLSTARSGEELEVQRRLAAAGWEVWWEPTAVVEHLVPPERLTRRFFRDYFRQRGLLEAARGRGRLSALHPLARSAARYAVLRALRRPDADTAKFTWAYAWALLTAPRRPV